MSMHTVWRRAAMGATALTLAFAMPLAIAQQYNYIVPTELKQQLEDLSFASLYPKRFAELDHLVATRSPEREVYLVKSIAEVQGRDADLQQAQQKLDELTR